MPIKKPVEKGGGGGAGVDYNAMVQNALVNLRRSLDSDSDCLGWLESGVAGRDLSTFNAYYNALDGANGSGVKLAGTQDFSNTPYSGANAVTNVGNNSIGSGFVITVNTQGAFFTNKLGVAFADKYADQISQILPATVQAQDFILLHELAHYFQAGGFTQNDGGDLAAQKRNNDLEWEKCRKSMVGGPLM
jgi:hypothetical protein